MGNPYLGKKHLTFVNATSAKHFPFKTLDRVQYLPIEQLTYLDKSLIRMKNSKDE